MIDVNMEEEDNAQESADREMEEDGVQERDFTRTEQRGPDAADVKMDESNKHQRVVRHFAITSLVPSQEEETSDRPDPELNLPFRQSSPGWSAQPDGQPQIFNFGAQAVFPVPRLNPVPRKSKKRDSDGNVKEMIAELNARTELVISRETTPSPVPRGRRPERALPSPGYWRWDTLGLSPLMFRPSPMSPRRTIEQNEASPYTNSRDVKEQHEEFRELEGRKRKGSLLEWRNKEMFDEPVRI